MPDRFVKRNEPDGWHPEGPPLSIGMGYEFDPEKDAINQQKHEYGLESGRDILERLTWPIGIAPPIVGLTQWGRDDGEVRHRVLTLDHECHLVDFIFTTRGSMGLDYAMRAISYRRAAYDLALLPLFLEHVDGHELLAWKRQCISEGLAPEAVEWSLSPEIPADRRRFLGREHNLGSLVRALRLHTTLTVVPCNGQPLEQAEARGLDGYSRMVARMEPVSEQGRPVLDYLFNGSRGLRYYFAIAPIIGAWATRELLSGICRDLEQASAALPAELRDRAMRSARAVSAKLWPAEGDLQLEPPRDVQPQIPIPRWVRARDIWKEQPQRESYLAGRGIQAPEPNAFEIKGGFIDDQGTEWIPDSKVDRAEHIYRWGWS